MPDIDSDTEEKDDLVVQDLAKLSRDALNFRLGTRRIYESQGDRADMWFFELWHFLGDVQDSIAELTALRSHLAAMRSALTACRRLDWASDPGMSALRAEVDAALNTTPGSAGETGLNFFSENVDRWGAAEWFNRLATAVRQQDAAVLANDSMAMETCRNVAASSAMRLIRDYEHQVRAALSHSEQE